MRASISRRASVLQARPPELLERETVGTGLSLQGDQRRRQHRPYQPAEREHCDRRARCSRCCSRAAIRSRSMTKGALILPRSRPARRARRAPARRRVREPHQPRRRDQAHARAARCCASGTAGRHAGTLADVGVPVGAMLAPVIPGLTDHEMERAARGRRRRGAQERRLSAAAPAIRSRRAVRGVAARALPATCGARAEPDPRHARRQAERSALRSSDAWGRARTPRCSAPGSRRPAGAMASATRRSVPALDTSAVRRVTRLRRARVNLFARDCGVSRMPTLRANLLVVYSEANPGIICPSLPRDRGAGRRIIHGRHPLLVLSARRAGPRAAGRSPGGLGALRRLSGCMTSKVDETRQVEPRSIQANESIVILKKPQLEGVGTEEEFLDCVQERWAANWCTRKQGQTAKWRTSQRRCHSRSTASRNSRTRCSRGSSRARRRQCGRAAHVTAATRRDGAAPADQGALHRLARRQHQEDRWRRQRACAAGPAEPAASASVGGKSSPTTSRRSGTCRTRRKSGRSARTSQGTSVLIGAIVPIPIITPVRGAACDRLSNQLRSFLEGNDMATSSPGTVATGSPRSERCACGHGSELLPLPGVPAHVDKLNRQPRRASNHRL